MTSLNETVQSTPLFQLYHLKEARFAESEAFRTKNWRKLLSLAGCHSLNTCVRISHFAALASTNGHPIVVELFCNRGRRDEVHLLLKGQKP